MPGTHDRKVSTVQGEDARYTKPFSHNDDGRVSKIQVGIGVPVEERDDSLQVGLLNGFESWFASSQFFKKTTHNRVPQARVNQVAKFGQDRRRQNEMASRGAHDARDGWVFTSTCVNQRV
jgi:hypothetical protein